MNTIKDPILDPYEIQLEQDSYTVIINYKPEKGREYRKPVSYHRNLTSCLESLMKYVMSERSYGSLREYMEEYNTINLWRKFKQLPEADQKNPSLVAAMRHYDLTVNITWVMGHFNAAKKYIESVPGNHEATGLS